MLVLLILLLFLLGIGMIFFIPTIFGWEIYEKYCGARAVICPENNRQVAVNIDAAHAAMTSVGRMNPKLRIFDCTRWPERARCEQKCLSDAVRAKPYCEREVRFPEKKIYHLPIFIAAAMAWLLGAVWHSQFVFRRAWGQALGLTPDETHIMAKSLLPHLLSVGVVLLFAYAVALLQGLSGRRGAAWGIAKATALWLVLAGAAMHIAIWNGVSADLLRMELCYTLLASVVIGAVIGGLNGRMSVSQLQAGKGTGRRNPDHIASA